MQLSIHSLKKTLYDGEAKSVTLASTTGELTILNNHLPLITTLAPGTIQVTEETGHIFKIAASSGTLEVQPGSKVAILVN